MEQIPPPLKVRRVDSMKKYVTASELAKILRISRCGLYALIRRGELPSGFKLGRSRRWDMSQVRTWLDERSKGV